MRGSRSYFGYCETPRVLVYLTGWVRRRGRRRGELFIARKSIAVQSPYETTIDITKPLRASACSLPLCLLAQQISSSMFASSSFRRTFGYSATLPLSLSAAVLWRTSSVHRQTPSSLNPVCIAPASVTTASGFLKVAVSKARNHHRARVGILTTLASDTALRLIGIDRCSTQTFSECGFVLGQVLE
jgi:hypothetical protein